MPPPVIGGGIVAVAGRVHADPCDADVMGGGEIDRHILHMRVTRMVGIHRIEELWHGGVSRHPVARITPRLIELDLLEQRLVPHVRQKPGHPANAISRLSIGEQGGSRIAGKSRGKSAWGNLTLGQAVFAQLSAGQTQ